MLWAIKNLMELSEQNKLMTTEKYSNEKLTVRRNARRLKYGFDQSMIL